MIKEITKDARVITKKGIGEMVARREKGVVVDVVEGPFGPVYSILFEGGWLEEMSIGDVDQFLLVSSGRISA